jgi:hypothetical protein
MRSVPLGLLGEVVEFLPRGDAVCVFGADDVERALAEKDPQRRLVHVHEFQDDRAGGLRVASLPGDSSPLFLQFSAQLVVGGQRLRPDR